jgi:hypothetical protein
MKRLVNYNAMAQHTGTWLRGYDWNIYGCGTYRQAESEVHAQALMKRYIERLARKLRAPVSFYASLERRYSGCGYSPIPVHWHFPAASVSSEAMAPMAIRITTGTIVDATIIHAPSSTKNDLGSHLETGHTLAKISERLAPQRA